MEAKCKTLNRLITFERGIPRISILRRLELRQILPMSYLMTHTSPDLFSWSSKYSMGIPDIDTQHKKLVAMLNELFKAMQRGEADKSLGALLESLIAYTEQHFTYEEGHMRRSGYRALAAHIEEHRALTRKVYALRDDFRAGRITISIQLTSFLKDWLQQHILRSDSQYARTFTAARVAVSATK
jgi:hemerythrin-like metal-binding protein